MRYYGHCAFLWTTPGGFRLLADPFQNPRGRPRWFLKRFPPMRVNMVAVTHDHFDHNATGDLKGYPTLLKARGLWRRPDIAVRLTPEVHAGRWPIPNFLVVIETGAVRFCHAGDNRWNLAPEALAGVGPVDVLMVPVDDSRHLLSFDEVQRMIDAFSPRVVVPMHYLAPGLTAPSSTLGGIDEWLSTLPEGVAVRRLGVAETEFRAGELPPEGRREVWVLDAAPGSA